MTTITATSIIDKAQVILQDKAGVHWPDVELLGWLNDGQRHVVLIKPNAYVKRTAIRLAAGTLQDLPADGVQLIDVPRNMGITGSTPGRAIRVTLREALDTQAPDWHSSAPSPVAKHFMYSLLDPKHFYVYPQNTGTGHVEMVYGAAPPDATLASAIALDDIYQTPLLDYMLYRGYSMDNEFSDDGQNAASIHYQAFLAAITGKAGAEAAAAPGWRGKSGAK